MLLSRIKKLAIVTMILLLSSQAVYSATKFPEALKEVEAQLEQTLSEAPLGQCKELLGQIYDIKILEFLKFLEENFENKSSTSSLTNIGVARYMKYKEDVDYTFTKLNAEASVSQSFKTQYPAYTECEKFKNTYLELARKQMIVHIQKNSAQKKSLIMEDKFKAVNNKLKDVNESLAGTYGFFMTFRNKLPGFLRQCIQN